MRTGSRRKATIFEALSDDEASGSSQQKSERDTTRQKRPVVPTLVRPTLLVPVQRHQMYMEAWWYADVVEIDCKIGDPIWNIIRKVRWGSAILNNYPDFRESKFEYTMCWEYIVDELVARGVVYFYPYSHQNHYLRKIENKFRLKIAEMQNWQHSKKLIAVNSDRNSIQ